MNETDALLRRADQTLAYAAFVRDMNRVEIRKSEDQIRVYEKARVSASKDFEHHKAEMRRLNFWVYSLILLIAVVSVWNVVARHP